MVNWQLPPAGLLAEPKRPELVGLLDRLNDLMPMLFETRAIDARAATDAVRALTDWAGENSPSMTDREDAAVAIACARAMAELGDVEALRRALSTEAAVRADAFAIIQHAALAGHAEVVRLLAEHALAIPDPIMVDALPNLVAFAGLRVEGPRGVAVVAAAVDFAPGHFAPGGKNVAYLTASAMTLGRPDLYEWVVDRYPEPFEQIAPYDIVLQLAACGAALRGHVAFLGVAEALLRRLDQDQKSCCLADAVAGHDANAPCPCDHPGSSVNHAAYAALACAAGAPPTAAALALVCRDRERTAAVLARWDGTPELAAAEAELAALPAAAWGAAKYALD